VLLVGVTSALAEAESIMPLKYYFPLSIAVFVLVVAAASYYSVPVMPFALILLAAETLLGFQVEDHRIPRFLTQLFRAPKTHGHIKPVV
jgi:hypothetical protein